MEYFRKTITLPICGQEAVIREADANAEDLLWEHKERLHKAYPQYWAYLTERLGDKTKVTAEDILQLLVPDQQYLALEIWRLTKGDRLELEGSCPHCGKPANYEVDLTGLDVLPLPEGSVPPDPLFDVVLPRSGHTVTLGYLTGKQELAELEIEGFNPTRMVFGAIRAIDGDSKVKLSDVRAWPLADHAAMRKAIKDNRCGLDTRVRFTHTCGRSVVMDLLTDPSFLLPGLPG